MATTSLTYGIFAKDNASPVFGRLSTNITKASRQSQGFSKSFAKMGGALAFAAKGAALSLGAMTAAGVTAGIKTAASLQQAQIGFESMLGSAERAGSFLERLKKFATATPFEMTGLVDSSRMLLGVGVSAKKIIPLLTDFGDAAGAVGIGGDAFSRIMLAMSQSIAAGKIKLGDMNQLMNNGLPIWKLLSQAIGKPVAAIQNMISHGQLLTKDVLPRLQAAMHQDYGGAMAKQSQTLSGLWSTFKDTLNLGLADAIKPLIPLLQGAMPGAMAAMGAGLAKVGDVVAKVVPRIKDLFGALNSGGAGSGFITWITGTLLPALAAMWRDYLPHVQKAFQSVGQTLSEHRSTFQALGQILTDIVLPIFGKLAGMIEDTVGPVFSAMMGVVRNFVIPGFILLADTVLGVLDAIISAAATAFGWVPGIGPKLKAANKNFDQFASGVNDSLRSIERLVQVDLVVKVRTVSSDIAGGIDGQNLTPQQAAAQNRANMAHAAAAAAKGTANKVKAQGVATTVAFADGLASAAPNVAAAGDKIKSAATKKFDEIKQAAQQAGDSMRSTVQGFFTLQSEGNPFRGLTAMAHKATAFAAAIGRLTRQGVPSGVISAIASLGPDQGTRAAQMLAGASQKDRNRVTGAFREVGRAANQAASYQTSAVTGEDRQVNRNQLTELREIRKAVTKHHRPNPLADGWAAY